MINLVDVTHKFTRKLGLDSDFYNLPYDVKISTITITCKLKDTTINVKTIGHYMDLNMKDIVYVKYGPDNILRTLIKLKQSYKTKTKKNFQNQVSVMIKLKNGRLIHVKLFLNGSIQMTGCKTIFNFVEAMTVLCKKLLTFKFAYDLVTKKTVRKTFVSGSDNVKIDKITKLKIRMINSNFHVGFMIDRVILYRLLLEKEFECSYDQCSHAGVNLKYKKGNDTISIFVFESGSVIITGVKNKQYIFDAYEFIVKLLYENFNRLIKIDAEKLLERRDVKKLLIEGN